MSWVENFLKINKRGGMSIRDQRVVRYHTVEYNSSSAGLLQTELFLKGLHFVDKQTKHSYVVRLQGYIP